MNEALTKAELGRYHAPELNLKVIVVVADVTEPYQRSAVSIIESAIPKEKRKTIKPLFDPDSIGDLLGYRIFAKKCDCVIMRVSEKQLRETIQYLSKGIDGFHVDVQQYSAKEVLRYKNEFRTKVKNFLIEKI